MAGDECKATVADAMTDPSKPVATEVNSNRVSPDRPAQVTNLAAPIKQPFKADSGDPVLPMNSPGHSLLGGQMLTPGEALTYSGTLISLASDGSQLIVGTSTHAVALPPSVTHQAGIPVVDLQDVALPAGTVVAQALETAQSSNSPSEGQSAVAEGQQQSLLYSHTVTTGGIVSVFGPPISLAPGLPSIVMATNVQATCSHGIGSSSSRLSNGTSPSAFQGSARRVHVIWRWLLLIAFVALMLIHFV